MYTPTIGIEVHAELKTNSKMFCGCKNDPHHSEPNANICPVCMGDPGSLPVVNKAAMEKVLMVGVALGSELATFTEFDRKHYFYPDLPKGYQISQYQYPLVKRGTLTGVSITRIHLEEDAARSQHEGHEGTLIDYNRAGVPLMELVTDPCIHDIETASRFVRELQLLLRTLNVSDANLEKGEMRLEANISMSKTDELGVKVEVKNLNSFSSFESAIMYEIKRQTELLEKGAVIIQETRGWDEHKQKTYTQRVKEGSEEYRYMPDPDIPKFDLSKIPEFNKSRLEENLPEIPEKKRIKYSNLGLPSNITNQIVSDINMAVFMDAVLMIINDRDEIRLVANYLTTDIPPILQEKGRVLDVRYAREMAMLASMIARKKITSRVAKDILPEVVLDGVDPEKITHERGLSQENNENTLLLVIDSVIEENTDAVAEYRSGKESVLQFLVGQGMKKTRGSANPELLANMLRSKIS